MGFKEVATFILSTSFVVGCGGSPVVASQIDQGPTLTPTPDQNTLVIDPTENNLHLGTPGAIETQMVSTAAAVELEKTLNNELISSKAVTSLVSITLLSDHGNTVASGNLAYLFGYPVILTSGHVYDGIDNNNSSSPILTINQFSSSDTTTLSFLNYKEAHIFDNKDGLNDIGVLVITDPAEIEYLTRAIGIDKMLTINDLRFDPIPFGEPVTGACYPRVTDPYLYPFSGTAREIWNLQVTIDGALTGPRCSGGGLFDSNEKYFASVSSGYEFYQFDDVPQDRWNNTYVFPLSSIGRDGLERLVNEAVSR